MIPADGIQGMESCAVCGAPIHPSWTTVVKVADRLVKEYESCGWDISPEMSDIQIMKRIRPHLADLADVIKAF